MLTKLRVLININWVLSPVFILKPVFFFELTEEKQVSILNCMHLSSFFRGSFFCGIISSLDKFGVVPSGELLQRITVGSMPLINFSVFFPVVLKKSSVFANNDYSI